MILTLITFLFVLSLLVLVHEGGHFLAAKKAGVKVEEFGLGYPPRVLGVNYKGTIYSLNAIPFGGFVRLLGEESFDVAQDKSAGKSAFWQKSKKARAAVIVAGVTANFLLAIVAFSVIYVVSGIPTKTALVKIVGILPDSPAQQAGIKEGDVILAVDEEKINNLEKFTSLVKEKSGMQIRVTLAREVANPCSEKVFGGGTGFSCQDGNLMLWLTPRSSPPDGEGPLGVVVSDVEMKKYSFWQMPFRGLVEGTKETMGWIKLTLTGLGTMLNDLFRHGAVPKDMAGPVGILQISGMAAQSGFWAVLQLIGILSVNLAVLNILPFPALDGGRLVFIGYEAIFRRRPKASFEHLVNTAGMALLLFLITLVTINDIGRILGTSSFLSRLRTLWPF